MPDKLKLLKKFVIDVIDDDFKLLVFYSVALVACGLFMLWEIWGCVK